MIRLLALAAGAGIAALAVKLFEKDESDSITEIENDESVNSEMNTETFAKHAYQRGDRFFCPVTGIELQVRAVGGRPRKNEV